MTSVLITKCAWPPLREPIIPTGNEKVDQNPAKSATTRSFLQAAPSFVFIAGTMRQAVLICWPLQVESTMHGELHRACSHVW